MAFVVLIFLSDLFIHICSCTIAFSSAATFVRYFLPSEPVSTPTASFVRWALQRTTTTLAPPPMKRYCPADNLIAILIPPHHLNCLPHLPLRLHLHLPLHLHALAPAHLPRSTFSHRSRVHLPLLHGLPPLVARRLLLSPLPWIALTSTLWMVVVSYMDIYGKPHGFALRHQHRLH